MGRRRWTRLVLPAYTWLMILYFSLPIMVMILFGFNDTKGRLNLRWQGFTLNWYRDLFSIPALSTALRNSLAIAVVSTIIATVIGTMIGLVLGFGVERLFHAMLFNAGGVDVVSYLIVVPFMCLATLLAASTAVGLEVMDELMAVEVTEVAGPHAPSG